MELTPVARTTLVQSVVDQIKAQIVEGTLAAGDRLPSERDLMKRLGVGRSTIREALRSLAMMNLVDLRPGQGCYVKGLGVQTLIRPDLLTTLLDRNVTVDLLEVRELIEPAGIELAAHRATPADLEALQGILDRCRAAHDEGRPTSDLSAGFHVAIARSTHNGVLVMFMESILELLTERGSKLESMPGYTEWEVASHQKIADAVRARDARRARRLMSQHLEESTQRLLGPLDPAPGKS